MKGYKEPSILESLIIAFDVLNEEYHCSCIAVMLWEILLALEYIIMMVAFKLWCFDSIKDKN